MDAIDDPSTPLFDALFDDGALLRTPTDVAPVLDAYRAHRLADHRDLVGPLLVPAVLAESVAQGLVGSDHALPVVLVADPSGSEAARQVVRAARDLFAEDDRVEIVGVRLAGPAGPAGEATQRLLDTLDFTAPSWIDVRPGTATGWRDVLAVVADDGAENVTVVVGTGRHPVPDDDLAAVLRRAVELDLTLRVGGAPTGLLAVRDDTAHGWLNLLCAVRAALAGDDVQAVTALVAQRDPAPLVAVLDGLTDGDAAALRSVVCAVQVDDVSAAVDALTALRLTASA